MGALLVAILVAAAAPASAGTATDAAWAGALSEVNERISALRADVARVRTELEGGGLLSVVRATAMAAEEPLTDDLATSVPQGEDLIEATETLVSAFRRAEAIVRASEASRIGNKLGIDRARSLLLRAVVAPETLRTSLPRPSVGPALRAAAVVAAAVDASLPALRAAAAATPRTQGAAAPCDVLDQSPELCVSGTGVNSYTSDESVIIDLGGDDVYENNAGGAPNDTTNQVALVLDLSGNDTYAPPPAQFAVEGTGVLGSVGMLADLSGNDSYRAVATTHRTRTGGAPGVALAESAGAQGQGMGALGGAGFLFDASGNDKYGIETTSTGTSAGSGGQGTGFFGGAGTLVDSGGDDTYEISATALPQPRTIPDEDGVKRDVTQYGFSGVSGQGFGGIFEGTGLLADSGGTDTLMMGARLAGSPVDGAPLYTEDPTTEVPTVSAVGQGVGGFGGVALLLEGTGKTTYSLSAEAEPTPTMDAGVPVSVLGQGAGGLAAGALSDVGGDDTYSVSASTSASVAATASDGCSPCPRFANATAGTVALDVQGVGLTGAGLLEDGGGNDTFSVSGSSESMLRLTDQRSSAGTPMFGNAMAGQAVAHMQGFGVAGTGALFNVGGDDVYAANMAKRVDAEGSALLPSNQPSVTTGTSLTAADGQGSGTTGAGALHDVGGSDSYRATASAIETPAAGSSVAVSGQGSGSSGLGVAVDVDGTGTDTYVQTPADPACSGTRGQGVWTDCGNVGIGANA